MAQELVFVHLSDIHFRQGDIGNPHDLNADLRNELERDIVAVRERFDHVAGFLVSGDIAFAGRSAEYEAAHSWLRQLCDTVDCPEENVWCTPGNHDVDRAVVEGRPMLQDMHRSLRPADPRNIDVNVIDEQIRRYCWEDPDYREAAYLPLREYNAFAAKFACRIGHDAPYWEHDFSLNDGSILRVRGLNSTLVSDASDDLGTNRLVLGSSQAMMPNEIGVAYLVMCHHPPLWLWDQDTAERLLNARARIQLFGHKHRQALDHINGTVRVTAGAVHPDRREPQWLPRYNYLSVSVEGAGAHRQLKTVVHPRVWLGSELTFGADRAANGGEWRTFLLPLDLWRPPNVTSQDTPRLPTTIRDTVAEEVGAGSGGGITVNPQAVPIRALTYHFLSLPFAKRLDIARKLQLLEESDTGLSEDELFAVIFRRAKEESLVGRLWEEVDAARIH